VADIAIVTAIYDGFDDVKPVLPQSGADCEWVLVTDDPRIPDGHLGWRVVYAPAPGVHPCRAAKAAKFRPWLFTDAAASIWVDGGYRVISDRFAAGALELAAPLAQFIHPWRDCIYEEAAASSHPKYAAEPITGQIRHYREAGHPEHWGLWEAGAIARVHGAEMTAFGDAWAAEVDRWSFQDQVSEPFVLRNLGLRPGLWPGMRPGNPWLAWEASSRH
jgi:TOD1/MUCI70, glycosyltransferase-like domain